MRRFISLACLGLALVLVGCATPGALQGTPSTAPATTTTAGTPQEFPAALEPAQARLAEILGVSREQIVLKSYEAVDWSDACLEAPVPEEACAQVVTPGYRAVFTTPQGEIEVHTDQSGQNFRTAQPLATPIGKTPALFWERSGGFAGICRTLTVDYTGNYTYQDCQPGPTPVAGMLTAEQQAQLEAMVARYKTFSWQIIPPANSADMYTERFTIYGKGSAEPSSQEQQEIAGFLAGMIGETPPAPGATQPASTQPAAGSSGIEVTALVGPACPGPVVVGKECPDQPLEVSFTVLGPGNQPVTQFQTDAQGKSRVSLPPGSYTLHPEVSGPYPRASDQPVTVSAGQYTQVTVQFDSGMR